jgi:hypothetical protein
MPTRRHGPSGNRLTWLPMLEASTRQRAGATDEPFTRAANSIMPAATTDVMDALAGSLDNLALAATSNKIAPQQLMAANLALTTTVASLTVANKKLTETEARFNLPPNLRGGYAGRGGEGAQCNAPRAIWGNYCWTHGYKTSHTSPICLAANWLPGHDASATVADTKGGKEWNKNWYLQGNKDT